MARDEIQTRQTEIRLQQLRNQAQLEVADALVAMRKARSSYEAALQTQALQQESLEAEQAKFQVGASTSFFIIQYESYLAQARSTVVVAKGAYLKARRLWNALSAPFWMTITFKSIRLFGAARSVKTSGTDSLTVAVRNEAPCYRAATVRESVLF